MSPSLRRVLIWGVFLLILGGAGYYFVRSKMPQLLDKEQENPAALAALQSAKLAAEPVSAEADWPQWFGPHRDGRAPDGPLRTDWTAKPPTVLWSIPCGGGYSSLAVVDGRVYVHDLQDGQERVRCLAAESGELHWEHGEPVNYSAAGISYGAGPRATPLVHDGKVYSFGATGILLGLEPVEGGSPKVVWRHDVVAEFGAKVPGWGLASSPLVDGDLVYIQAGGGLGSLAAFDKTTGKLVWKAGDDPVGYSSPVVADVAGVRQVIAVSGTSAFGVEAKTGAMLWQTDWETQHHGNIATPLVIGDYVFLSSNYGKGCELLHLTGDAGKVAAEIVYFRKGRVMMNHHSTSVHRDGYLYGYDMNDLRCVNLREGEIEEHWRAKDANGRSLAKGCVIRAGEHLIGLTQTGTLFLADADPEEFVFHGQVEGVLAGSDTWALPVLVDGRIYLRDSEKVVCLDVRP